MARNIRRKAHTRRLSNGKKVRVKGHTVKFPNRSRHSLNTDRGIQAQTVYRNTASGRKNYRNSPKNRSDLAGFDTRRRGAKKKGKKRR